MLICRQTPYNEISLTSELLTNACKKLHVIDQEKDCKALQDEYEIALMTYTINTAAIFKLRTKIPYEKPFQNAEKEMFKKLKITATLFLKGSCDPESTISYVPNEIILTILRYYKEMFEAATLDILFFNKNSEKEIQAIKDSLHYYANCF